MRSFSGLARLGPALWINLAFVEISTSGYAQTVMVWEGGPGVGNANNWHANPSWITVQPGSTQIAQFDNTAGADSLAPSIGTTATSVGSIVFAPGTTNAYKISGTETLTIGSATVAGITNNSATNQQFSVSTIALGFAQAWNVANTGNLSISSNVVNAGTTLTLQGSSTGTGTISGVISGTGGLSKSGTGTWTLSGANNFSGGTTISSGTLRFTGTNTNVGNVSVAAGGVLEIGATNTLPATTGLTLSGGTLAMTGAFNQTFGTLNLALASAINFGAALGASTVSFANSSGLDWLGNTLTISNYASGSDRLRFGTDGTGLTLAQLAGINFTGFDPGAQIDGGGFVTPVPEPSTYAAIVGAMALAVAGYRRRRARARASAVVEA